MAEITVQIKKDGKTFLQKMDTEKADVVSEDKDSVKDDQHFVLYYWGEETFDVDGYMMGTLSQKTMGFMILHLTENLYNIYGFDAMDLLVDLLTEMREQKKKNPEGE